MAKALDNIQHSAERAIASKLADAVLSKKGSERSKVFLQILNLGRKFWGKGFSAGMKEQARHFRIRITAGFIISTVFSTKPILIWQRPLFSTWVLRALSAEQKLSAICVKYITATSRGSSCSTRHRPATCTVWAAGQAPTVTNTT